MAYVLQLTVYTSFYFFDFAFYCLPKASNEMMNMEGFIVAIFNIIDRVNS